MNMEKHKQKAFKGYTEEQIKNMSSYELDSIAEVYTKKLIIKYILLGVVALVLIITFFKSFTTIPSGYVGIKTRFGKVQNDTIQEGLNLKVPYIEKIIKLDCRTKKIETTSESSTKDLQIVNVSVVLNYNVMKDTSNVLYREIGLDYENIIIQPAILESIKSIMAQYTAEELITRRSEVSAMILEEIFNKIHDKGFGVTEFNITNIDFSDEYNKAIETKAVKQQEVEAAKAELEKQKIQNEKEISVAEKDAKVMELQNSQITDKTLQLKALEVKEKLINKWDGKLPQTSLGDGIDTLFNLGN